MKVLKRRPGFMISVMLISCTALMGFYGMYYYVHQREEARGHNTASVMRAMSSLLNAVNQHYVEFIDTFYEEWDYFLEQTEDMDAEGTWNYTSNSNNVRSSAKSSLTKAWAPNGEFDFTVGEDLVEDVTTFIARLGLEDIVDPTDLKFVESCTVTTRVVFMLMDNILLGDDFPFNYLPGLWTIKINLQCAPTYFFSPEALNRAGVPIRLYGETSSSDLEAVNVSLNKLSSSEIEILMTYRMQTRENWSQY